MRTLGKRICSIVVVFCIIFTIFPLPVHAATSEDKEKEITIKQYEEFINKKYYFNLLTTDGNLYYKRWVNNLENQNVFGQGLQWITSVSLDMNLSVADYTMYLSKLIAMLEKRYTESEAAQKDFDDSMALFGDLGDSIKTSSSALELTVDVVGGELFDSAKTTVKTMGLPIDVVDLGESVISDLDQLKVLTLSNITQAHKRKILESIRDSTDIQKLKIAASDMLEVMDVEYLYEYICILDNYAWDSIKIALDFADAANMSAKIKAVVSNRFPDWYNKLANSRLSKAATELLKKTGTFLSYAGAVFQGFSIGADIMKSIVGEDAELMKEALAMDDISDAFSLALKNIHSATSSGTNEEKAAKIKDFILIGTVQILTHFRGEYCHLQSTATLTINTAFQKSDYLKKFSGICDETQSLLNGILEVDPSSYLEVAWIKVYGQYGDSEIYFEYNDNGDIDLVTYYSVSESEERTKTSECKYTYDTQSRLINVQPENYPFPKAEYHYNGIGQLISYSAGEGSIVNYTLEYDTDGKLIRKTGVDITTNIITYTYDHLDRIVSQRETVNMPDGSPSVVWLTKYEYDENGRKTQTTFDDGYRKTTYQFCYDFLPFHTTVQDNTKQISLLDSMGEEVWSGTFENAQFLVNNDGILTSITSANSSGFNERCEIGYNVEVNRTVNVNESEDLPDVSEDGYDLVFNQYRSAQATNYTNCGEYISETLPLLVQWGSNFDIYYLQFDLNDDGIDELLIGGKDTASTSDSIIKFDLFTLNNNKPVRLLGEFGHRSHLYLYTDGTIKTSGSGGASSNYTYIYTFPPNALEVSLIKGYGTEMGEPFYTEADGTTHSITTDELQTLSAATDSTEMQIEWSKLE